MWNALMWCLIAGIVGARLYHVFSSPQGTTIGFQYYFVTHPFEPIDVLGLSVPFPTALMIWNGGLGIFGAIVGGMLAILVYTRRNHLPLVKWLDIGIVGLPLGQAIGRWGNYINQELYGPPTTLPWGIPIDAQHRIPPYTDLISLPRGDHPLPSCLSLRVALEPARLRRSHGHWPLLPGSLERRRYSLLVSHFLWDRPPLGRVAAP